MIELGVLGPLRATAGGGELSLGGRRQQTVLAVLAMAGGDVVGVDHLGDVLWGETPPSTFRTQVAICVANLRKLLAPHAEGPTIRTLSPGYALVPEAFDIDADLFRSLVERARAVHRDGDVAGAVRTMGDALALWRGEPLAGIDSVEVSAAVQGLQERSLDAAEDRFEWMAGQDTDRELLPELRDFVERHPTRERSRWLLVNALARAGRRVDALADLRAYREFLHDQLGIDPPEEFGALERSLLGSQPAAPGPTPIAEDDRQSASPADTLVEPATVRAFGREDELALLDEVWRERDRDMRPVVISGKPLVGKSTLVRAWLSRAAQLGVGAVHRVTATDSGPDVPRRLLLDALRSMTPEPVDDTETEIELQDRLTGVLARTGGVLVLDDIPTGMVGLLPASGPDSVVIATCRGRRAGTDVRCVPLSPWSRGVAAEYLCRRLSPERVTDDVALDLLLATTGGAPAVVVGVANLLRNRPHWTIGDLAVHTEALLREVSEVDADAAAAMRSVRSHLRPGSVRALVAMSWGTSRRATASEIARRLNRPAGETRRALELLVDECVLHVAGRADDGSFRYGISEMMLACARLLDDADHASYQLVPA